MLTLFDTERGGITQLLANRLTASGDAHFFRSVSGAIAPPPPKGGAERKVPFRGFRGRALKQYVLNIAPQPPKGGADLNNVYREKNTRMAGLFSFSLPLALFLGMIMGLTSPTQAGDNLSEFLKKVETQHPTIQHYKHAQEAADQKRVQADLLTETHIFGQVQTLSETKPGNFSSFIGEQTFSYGGQAGLSGLWETGTQWRTGLQLTSTSLPGANPSLVSEKEYGEGRLFVEITQPLWKDAWDTGLLRNKKQVMTASDIDFAKMSYGITQTLVEAEMAYWQYAVLSQLLYEATEASARAKEILAWTENRRSSALVQDNEVAQAKATAALRDLELEQARADWKQAQRALQYWVKAPTSDKLPDDATLLSQKLPARAPQRSDLIAQMAATQLALLSAEATVEAGKPNLSMSGNISLNQRESDIGSVLSSTLSTRYPSIGFTLALDIPMDADAHQKQADGYYKTWESEQQKTKALAQNIDTSWENTVNSITSAKLRLTKAKILEKAQYTKWQLESERHKKGRSTLSQVLNFEQDYANAKSTVLRTKRDLLIAFAQAKLFGETL